MTGICISIYFSALIAEVILYSEGFQSSKGLSHKMVQMYKLCSEQLSQQDHYDFGMRAVKSVLVMAGSLKRANPDRNEDVVLICALRDSNLPKFLAEDALLFQVIFLIWCYFFSFLLNSTLRNQFYVVERHFLYDFRLDSSTSSDVAL